ncbi:MAG: ferredoxin [Streptosporangiaceae bacterium]
MSRDGADRADGRRSGGSRSGERSGEGRDRRQGEPPPELKVNPIACEGHGMCIELLPELIAPDPWGYPLIAPGPVPEHLLGLARRAVNSCPTLALLLTRSAEPAPDDLPSREAAG